jgi:NAD-binding of NADP-dependent 3-hydroxyisobutyrate dehydrogenase
VQAAAEALALVQTAGVPLEKFVAAMQGNASNSKTLDFKLPKMTKGNFEPHFSVKHMLKDMQIASRLGLANHLELGVTSAARDRLLEQMQRGFGDEDYSVVARKYFPDIRPASREEADLELFEPRATILAPVAGAHVDVGENKQFSGLVQPVPQSVESKNEVDISLLVAPPSDAPVADVPAEQPTEQVKPAIAPTHHTAEFEQEPLREEAESPQGFFERLLRRGNSR